MQLDWDIGAGLLSNAEAMELAAGDYMGAIETVRY